MYCLEQPRAGRDSTTGDAHHLTAFRVDTATGALQAHGEPVPLPSRPIHMSLDRTGNFALTAYNLPSSVTVHRINRDGTIGALVQQPAPLDTGIYAHQILATPDNRAVILVTRGNDPAGGKPEDPGALKVFRFDDGVLSNLASIAPGGGYGFGPRHLDFHPTQPWVYVARERENKLDVYRLDGERLSAAPAVREGHPGPAANLPADARPPAPSTCIPAAGSSMSPIAPAPPCRSRASRSSRAARTPSRCMPSTSAAASRR